jgi:hypothetical protein
MRAFRATGAVACATHQADISERLVFTAAACSIAIEDPSRADIARVCLDAANEIKRLRRLVLSLRKRLANSRRETGHCC